MDKHECVHKLSSSVRTSRGVGRIAMTQKRLLLLAEGRPGFTEICTFRDIEVRASPPTLGEAVSPAPRGPRVPRSSPCQLCQTGPWNSTQRNVEGGEERAAALKRCDASACGQQLAARRAQLWSAG